MWTILSHNYQTYLSGQSDVIRCLESLRRLCHNFLICFYVSPDPACQNVILVDLLKRLKYNKF